MLGRKTLIFIISGLLLASSIMAGKNNDNVGTTVFNFLKIENGARPLAMGGAFTGLADDANALYYNPSGIADMNGKYFIAGYHNNFFDIQTGFLGFVYSLDTNKSLAIQLNYLDYGEFIRTDITGEENGTFGGSDMMLAGTFAMKFDRNLYLGVTGKFIYEKIDSYSSTGLAADLGAKYIVGRDRYSDSTMTTIGLSVQNLGIQMTKFDDNGESYSLPIIARAGVASRLKELPFMVAADVVKPMDNDFYFAFGMEIIKLQPLYIRLGYSTFGSNYKTNSSKDDLAGFSAGFGVEYNQMEISYTIAPQAELGTSHRVTFSWGLE